MAGLKLLLSPRASNACAICRSNSTSLLAGPEGGLNQDEEGRAIAAGWQPLKLGERILRTETAAVAAVAALQTVWGDF